MMEEQPGKIYLEGIKDGIPIGSGYFAVAFALGIAAKKAGLTALSASLSSLLCYASAGEYAGFTVIAADAPYFEMALITLVVNARYLLMSASLAQRMPEHASLKNRLGAGMFITDEIFGAAVLRRGPVSSSYILGLASFAIPCWTAGTFLGVIAGNLLPAVLVTALSVGLYGMFLAVIMPEARKNSAVRILVALSMAASGFLSRFVYTARWSEGSRILLLTIVISLLAAIFAPVPEEEPHEA